MSCILHIETSTEACSVAVSEDGLAVFSKEDLKGPSHAVQLGVFVDEALSFMAMYEQYEAFDELEDEFLEKEEEYTALVAGYVDEHLELFAKIV